MTDRPVPRPASAQEAQRFPDGPIVLVDDEQGVLDSYELTLISEGFNHIVKFSDSRELEGWIAANEASAVVLDLSMPHVGGMEVLKQLQYAAPDVGVIVCTAHDDLTLAVSCMRLGAADYLVKPVEPSRFVAAVRNIVERWDLRRENERLRSRLLEVGSTVAEAFRPIVTGHPKMQAVFRYIEAVAPTIRPVLIVGETGVGKEQLAQAVHEVSGRRGRFVAANIAEFDDALMSDTLFGHVRGAFTGADRDRDGLVEQARGGTLFLDEIGDLQPASQVKLLRLLQEQQYLPVGADRPRHSEARIVLATHRDLNRMVQDGTFRKDLYYRVSAHRVEVPPLRDRGDDVLLLLQHFVTQGSADLGKPAPRIPPEAFELLLRCEFPGNVRELQGLVFDAVATARQGILSLESFRARAKRADPAGNRPARSVGSVPTPGRAPRPTLAEAEQQLIQEALHEAGGNQTQAAKLLGISRTALIRRLKKQPG